MEVIGVKMLMGSLSMTHASSRLSGTLSPSEAMPVSSPGTMPRLHTLAASAVESSPAFCMKIQTKAMMPSSRYVITGVRRVGLSSLIGNIPGSHHGHGAA